ncbi:uncharacterized protein ACN2A1_002157 [Glossina fuscipes fuscipes]
MAWIWEKICSTMDSLVRPTQRKTRVTFSPSTLHRELDRRMSGATSINPFFNFLAEVRIKAQGNSHRGNAPKAAARLWKMMSDDEKRPYRLIAVEEQRLKRLRPKRKSIAKSLHKRRNNSQASLPNDNYRQFSNNPETHQAINLNADILGAGGDCGHTYNSDPANVN